MNNTFLIHFFDNRSLTDNPFTCESLCTVLDDALEIVHPTTKETHRIRYCDLSDLSFEIGLVGFGHMLKIDKPALNICCKINGEYTTILADRKNWKSDAAKKFVEIISQQHEVNALPAYYVYTSAKFMLFKLLYLFR